MSDVHIRTGRPDDVPAILELWGRADAPPTLTDDEAALRAVLDRDAESIYVATIGDELVGSVIVAWDGWRGNMYRLAVHPDYRRRGIAALLVAEGESRLRALGCRRVTALVLTNEPGAKQLWASVGYEKQPEMARFRKNL
ncbi:MAG: GNAT family N-acetyltransferase [Actinomycetota bacterium]